MATFDWPRELAPKSSKFYVVYNDMDFTSIFTSDQQIVSFPGDYWTLNMILPPLGRDKERLLMATVDQLRGRQNKFRFRDYRFIQPVSAGSPVVDGAGQLGAQLRTRGWTPNQRVLRAADYVTVNEQLLRVTADVRSGNDGRAVLPLNIFLRSPPVSGQAVNYRSPYAVMRFINPENPINRQVGQAGITIQAREAF
ncbi:hypothetical protein HW452_05070 [Halomonas aquamarina]|uniref:Uncharacterized protein n=1 Tax=Vreelandella aquamarina TaxID=77097 RepID=A0ACC5VRX2_9GAMM|nr:hypothetical protein [Halomonas aquamarina]MBZ5486892.1 hypothetical protein [Halomonas aquamarina]